MLEEKGQVPDTTKTNTNHTAARLLRLGQVEMRENESCARAKVGKNED